ncbi:unnamed protein product, partial [Heterosigma akashiwo]
EQTRYHPPGKFEVYNDEFQLDGSPIQVFACEIHYFRIHPGYWKDRIGQIKSLGCNALQIYVPWNLHEPEPGVYNFEGLADLERFLEYAANFEMFVSFRPGPYICAEWDGGGLPWWLLSHDPPIQLRTNDSRFLTPIQSWFDFLLPKMVPFLYENGGPIVMTQIENEYGAWGDALNNQGDRAYLEFLVELVEMHFGLNHIIFTTDWQELERMQAGSINGSRVLTAGDFGQPSVPEQSWKNADKMNPPGRRVKFNPESYTGWLTRWGEGFHNGSAINVSRLIIDQLNKGGNVAIYMAHGGTNFGFWAGASGSSDKPFEYALTSYDYNAFIAEDGGHNTGLEDKVGIRHAIQRFVEWNAAHSFADPTLSDNTERSGVRHLAIMREVSDLLSPATLTALAPNGPISTQDPRSMEQLGLGQGFALYRTFLSSHRGDSKIGRKLEVQGVHDHALVFLNQDFLGSVQRSQSPNSTLELPSFSGTGGQSGETGVEYFNAPQLDILVENLGHINFNESGMFDRKGLIGKVLHKDQALKQWDTFLLAMKEEHLASLTFHSLSKGPNSLVTRGRLKISTNIEWDAPQNTAWPAFYRGYFSVGDRHDLHANMGCWNRGVVWINGFNLGRFNIQGPQQTLYVPKFLLKSNADNEVLVLEL